MFNLDPDSPVRLTSRAARRFSGSAQFTSQMSRESVNQSRAPSMSPGNVSERPGWFVKITDGPELSSGSPVKGLYKALMQSLTYDPGAIDVATAITWAAASDLIKVWVAPRPGQTLAVGDEGFAEAVADLDGIPIMAVINSITASTPGAIYGKITAIGTVTGETNRYAFTQYAPTITGTPTAVTDGVVGTIASGWVQDIRGFSDAGLIGLYAWMAPNPTVLNTYVMGPWQKYVERKVNPTGTFTCNIDQTATVTFTYTDTTRFYIGG